MAKTIELDTKGLDILRTLIEDEGRAIKSWVISDGVEYGVHQEFGERGHPSLVPAFEKHTKQLPEIIGAIIEQAASKGSGTRKINDVLGAIAFNIAADWAADVNVDTGAYKNSIRARVE